MAVFLAIICKCAHFMHTSSSALLPNALQSLEFEANLTVSELTVHLSGSWDVPKLLPSSEASISFAGLHDFNSSVGDLSRPTVSDALRLSNQIPEYQISGVGENRLVLLERLMMERNAQLTFGSFGKSGTSALSLTSCGGVTGRIRAGPDMSFSSGFVDAPNGHAVENQTINERNGAEVRFFQSSNERTRNCSDQQSSIVRLPLSAPVELGPMRIAHIDLSTITGKDVDRAASTILSGTVSGEQIKREYYFAPGDQLVLGDVQRLAIRSLRYDPERAEYHVLLKGAVKSLGVDERWSQFETVKVDLTPSMLSYLLNGAFTAFLFAVLGSILVIIFEVRLKL